MPDRPLTIASYAAGASLVALALAYVFGPTFFPAEEDVASNGRTARTVGLSNASNDCFINSVLQALSGSEQLRVYLLRQCRRLQLADELGGGAYGERVGRLPKKQDLLKGDITRALKVMLDKLNQRPTYRKTIPPSDFIRRFESAFGKHLSRQQQDAQEFLHIVAERLDDEHRALRDWLSTEPVSRTAQGRAALVSGSAVDSTTTAANGNISAEQTGEGDKDQIGERSELEVFPLKGKLESQIQCQTCHYKPKATVSSFVTLTLNVPQERTTTLDRCLDGLLKVEYIDGYKCDRCRLERVLQAKESAAAKSKSTDDTARLDKEAGAIKTALNDSSTDLEQMRFAEDDLAPARRIAKHVRISEYPVLLVIHLSRSIFDSSFSAKNTANVEFPETLHLGGFEKQTYKLACLVIHRGGHDSGHYETFRRQDVADPEMLTQAPTAFEPDYVSPARDRRSIAMSDTADTLQNDSLTVCPQSHTSHMSDALDPENEVKALAKLKKAKRRLKERWWRISDDKVRECDTQETLSMQRDAYLLLYEFQSLR